MVRFASLAKAAVGLTILPVGASPALEARTFDYTAHLAFTPQGSNTKAIEAGVLYSHVLFRIGRLPGLSR